MTLVTKPLAEAIEKARGEAMDQIVKLSFDTPARDAETTATRAPKTESSSSRTKAAKIE